MKISNIVGKYKNILLFSTILGLLSSVVELVTIASIVPLVTVLIEPVRIRQLLQTYINLDYKDGELIVVIVFAFCGMLLLSLLFRSILFWLNAVIARVIGEAINKSIVSRIFQSNFQDIYQSNLSEILANLTTRSETITINYIQMLLNMYVSILLFLVIVSGIIWHNSYLALFFFLPIILSYILVQKIVSKYNRINAIEIYRLQGRMNLLIEEMYKGYAEIYIYKGEEHAKEKISHCDHLIKKAKSNSQILNNIPRYIMEVLSFIALGLVMLLMYYLNLENIYIIESISLLAFSTTRLVPLAHQIFSSYNIMEQGKVSMSLLTEFYEKCASKNDQKISYNYNGTQLLNYKYKFFKLDFKNIHFKYNEYNSFELNDLSFSIIRGRSYRINGVAGSGKSTLLKMIAGLYEYTTGEVKFNETKVNSSFLRDLVSYVPQEPFIIEGTIKENILFFSSDNIDYLLYNKIYEGLDLELIERSSRNESISKNRMYSGGERQLIALARALYNKRDLILIDEGVNALDRKHRSKVIEFISKMQDTIIYVTHHEADIFPNSVLINV